MSGAGEGAFAYVDQSDQRVWLSEDPLGRAPRRRDRCRRSRPRTRLHRHGGLAATPDGSWVLAVREEHRADGERRPRHTVVALSTTSTEPCACIVVEGHDFFGTARVDPAGERLAVVAWDHPDMPWDSSLLLVVRARRDPGRVRAPGAGAVGLAHDGGRLAPVSPSASPRGTRNGALRSVSDSRGWWQPYVQAGRPSRRTATRLTDVDAEFHAPDWVLGQSTMAELADGTVVARMSAGAGTRSWPCTPTGCRPHPRCSPLAPAARAALRDDHRALRAR